MSLSLVSATPDGFHPLTAEEFDQLQLQQFRHDETYHREIARLSVQNRLTHMTLHFAKYAGYLAEGGDDQRIRQVATDIFIIALSSGNILNQRFSDVIDLLTAARDADTMDFVRHLTISSGRMSAACEKLDHLEDFPFRSTIKEGVNDIMKGVLAFCASNKWDLRDLVRMRLEGIRAKSIFNDKSL